MQEFLQRILPLQDGKNSTSFADNSGCAGIVMKFFGYEILGWGGMFYSFWSLIQGFM